MKYPRYFILLLCFHVAPPLFAENQNLEHVLSLAVRDSDRFRTIDQSIEALKLELNSRDTSLSSTFQTELSTLRDSRDSLGIDPDRTVKTGLLGVTFTQPFSTGTQLSVSANNNLSKWDLPGQDANTAVWELKLSQSLWKNSFGHGIWLRIERDKQELNERTLTLQYEKQNLIVALESLYWDFILGLKELELRKENVKYSQILESWSTKRFRQFAAENADLIQMQSLLGQRQLDLLAAQNQMERLRRQLAQYLNGIDFSQWQFDSKEFEVNRDVNQLVLGAKPNSSAAPVRIDALSAQYSSLRYRSESEIEKDLYRPDLNVFVSYGGQGINDKVNTSWDRSFGQPSSMEKIGVLFTYSLDVGRQAEQTKAAARLAESYDSKSRSLQVQSLEGWNRLQSDLVSLKEQIKIARKVYEQNKKRISLERKRFQQGRTSTLQMTTAEIEISDSELRFYRLVNELRKVEAQARTYIYADAGVSK